MNFFEAMGAGFYTLMFFLLPILLLIVPFVCMVNQHMYRKSNYWSRPIRHWWDDDGIVICLVGLVLDFLLWVPYAHVTKFYGSEMTHLSTLSYVYEVGTYGWVLWWIILAVILFFFLPAVVGNFIVYIKKKKKKSRSK